MKAVPLRPSFPRPAGPDAPPVIVRPDPSAAGAPARVSAVVDAGGEEFPVYLACEDAPPAWTAEARLTLGLIPAMRRGLPLAVDEPASPHLLAGLATVQDIYHAWRPELERVPVRAAPGVAPGRTATGRVATCFSGGVDSFFTLLKHEPEITDLIFVHGFDIELDDAPLRAASSAMIRAVGAALGKRVLEVETNLKSLLDPHLPWSMAHGAALATVAHALGAHFDRVYVPSSSSYHALIPWGSHPLVDRHWGTERLAFEHDGCEARRIAKVGRIAASDVALAHLRVCYRNPGGAYNCGRCEKCVRTMISLHAAGALGRCRTFPDALDLARVRRLPFGTESARIFVRENVAALRARGGDDELVRVLEAKLGPAAPPGPPSRVGRLARLARVAKAGVRRLSLFGST